MEEGAGCLIEGGARSARGPVGILTGEPWLDEPPSGGLKFITRPAAEASTLPLRPCSSTAFLTEGCVGSKALDVDMKGWRTGEFSEKRFEMLASSNSLVIVLMEAGDDWR